MAKAPITTSAQVAPASPDAELIRLLAAAEAACRTWQYADPGKPTLAELIAERPWTPMVQQAAAMPASTPEGIQAKAQAVRWWIMGDGQDTPDHLRLHGPIELLAASLVKDVLANTESSPPATMEDCAALEFESDGGACLMALNDSPTINARLHSHGNSVRVAAAALSLDHHAVRKACAAEPLSFQEACESITETLDFFEGVMDVLHTGRTRYMAGLSYVEIQSGTQNRA